LDNVYNQAASESTEKVPITGNKSLRKLFEQKVKGTVFWKPWYNVNLGTDINSDGSNWLNYLKKVQADHAYPTMKPKLVEKQTPTSKQLGLNPKSQEYTQAQKTVDGGGQCVACNELSHKLKDCWLIKLHKEVRAHVFQTEKPNMPKKHHYCILHGHTNTHPTDSCFTIKGMAKDPQRFKRLLMEDKDKPLSERKGYHEQTGFFHGRRTATEKSTGSKDSKQENVELLQRNKELEAKVLVLKRTRQLEMEVQGLEETPAPSLKKTKTNPKPNSEDLVTITVPRSSLNLEGSGH
jgi:hypothetical protein